MQISWRPIAQFAKLLMLGMCCSCNKQVCGTLPRVEYPERLEYFRDSVNLSKIDTIPVIFHVLYKNETENISEILIEKILETINEDFSGSNGDIQNLPAALQSRMGNPKLVFIKSTILGDRFIVRKPAALRRYKPKSRNAFVESKIVDSKRNLNVYVCDVSNGTNAYTPTENNPNHDGIVIDYQKVFKGSRTLTHEIGHWLSLSHVFEKGCKDGDKVGDTPAQLKNFGCPNYPKMQCENSVLFMNFMDYSDCRIFFTAGQVERMKQYIYEYKDF